MMGGNQRKREPGHSWIGSALFLLCLGSVVAQAEVIRDGTMGPSGAIAGPDFFIPNSDGATFGSNLFHSFSVFNIALSESATFTGPAVIDNVIARVTGGSSSSIDGLLSSTIESADFWFINPAGVIFGRNASLNVDGSFHVSTADYLRLGNGGRFDATAPSDTVLTSAAPEAFGFLGQNPRPIRVNGSALEVPEGETISIVGGDVSVTSANVTAPAGRINLVGVASAGEAAPAADGMDVSTFSAMGTVSVTDPSFSDPAVLSTSGDVGGPVYIRAGRFVASYSDIHSETFGNADGYDVSIVANDVELRDVTFIFVDNYGSGQGGDLRIEAENIHIADFSDITTDTFGSGNAGSIFIEASLIEVAYSDITSNSFGGTGAGNAGNITLAGEDLVLIGAFLFVDSYGAGDAGSISLTASGSIEILDFSWITSESFADGDAGDISLAASESIAISGFSILSSTNQGAGDAGSVSIVAPLVEIVDSDIAADAYGYDFEDGGLIGTGTGVAGNITIEGDNIALIDAFLFVTTAGAGNAGKILLTATDSIEISDFSLITSDTYGAGAAGDIVITALQAVSISGFSTVSSDTYADGAGGTVTVEAPLVEVVDGDLFTGSLDFDGPDGGDAGSIRLAGDMLVLSGAFLLAETFGAGDAGSISLSASESIRISGGSTLDTTSYFEAGDAGSISLSADQISLDDSSISAISFGPGFAGDIVIIAGSLFESQGSSLTTEARESDGGNIFFMASDLVSFMDSIVSTSVGRGEGKGGNITIDPEFVVLINSDILAQAYEGPGGNIKIVAGVFLQSPDSLVDASSARGIDGTVTIASPDTDVSGSITVLPESYLDATTLMSQRCGAQSGTGRSSLVADTGNIPVPEPGGALIASARETPSFNITRKDEPVSGTESIRLASVTSAAASGCGTGSPGS
ncbi:MAG: filamentous hemagglutinin N-terminal domain-containing protein [Gammaproteobacteria bacterium]|nr:filamentous hemagglutinin N-terminal domain-containing protein [Gammaproteobacteria bacterium]